MSADNEVLWVVECCHPLKHWVFRTREAARKFVKDKAMRSGEYAIYRATWGPEQ